MLLHKFVDSIGHSVPVQCRYPHLYRQMPPGSVAGCATPLLYTRRSGFRLCIYAFSVSSWAEVAPSYISWNTLRSVASLGVRISGSGSKPSTVGTLTVWFMVLAPVSGRLAVASSGLCHQRPQFCRSTHSFHRPRATTTKPTFAPAC